ncbi:hypothetical protein RBG61_00510 [Paludicola sp. MB14-C6]|uniref:hypothetical protein n=1 Tax=Paludihabitans sp. MB14-C6 TaxID=3070656 RepID=UPI0027DB2E34|nr:hypothetical protein [Paludicola sp. MB14-C6]WMJ23172.1 hypothetical protein RBG61_00510 [Paludicola sp. MB14-C6]
MIKQKNKDAVIDQYISSCHIMYEATLSGDYKKNNAEGKQIVKTFKLLEKDLQFAEECLVTLLENDNVVVKTKAAAHCLALNIRINEAERILELAATDEKNGILGFNAQMTLNVWREQGYLKVYQK